MAPGLVPVLARVLVRAQELEPARSRVARDLPGWTQEQVLAQAANSIPLVVCQDRPVRRLVPPAWQPVPPTTRLAPTEIAGESVPPVFRRQIRRSRSWFSSLSKETWETKKAR